MFQQGIFEHLNIGRILTGRQREIFGVSYPCFLDYAKAFGCEDHNKVWKILQEMGIPDHLTCLLRNLYAGQKAMVRTERWTGSRLGKEYIKAVYCQFSSVQSLSRVQRTQWTAVSQASLSITNSWSLLKLMFIKLVMPSNHLCCRLLLLSHPTLLCYPLLLLPSIFPSIGVFFNESVLRIWWPKYIVTLLI